LRFPGSQQYRWSLRTSEGPVTLPVAGRFDADDGDVLTEWALMGEGIVMKPLWEIARHLRDGRLRPLLLDHPPEPAVLAVLYPHRKLLPARVKAFADFMVEHGARALGAETEGLDLAALASS
jgi:DNA-binding transcriptional LysR family regulator